MSFFKKLFGKKEENKPQETNIPQNNANHVPIKLTEQRKKSLEICVQAGFKPARSLPTTWDTNLRPAVEIAGRLHAIKAMILWLLVPAENVPDEPILSFITNNKLDAFMSDDELKIFTSPRDDEQLRNAIGWKFENAWPLAWYFGYDEPEIYGNMMSGEQMQVILMDFTASLEDNLEEWVSEQTTLSEAEIIQKEDLFYCLHNAVRSAQYGRDTVPKGFDPMANGGVIHERRHSLTWMLSTGTDWDDTDLST
jgi:hypothetical protein